MTLARLLVDWAWTVGPQTAPPEVTAGVQRHLLDALGCAVAAVRSDAALPALTVAALDGDGPCRVPGTDLTLPAPAAALATGVLIHALDFDDTHAGGLVHASAPVVAAALAAGQEHARSGAEVLTAITVGLEVICRLGAAVQHGFHARGFHATSVCGTPAAALVAARLAGLDPGTAAHAVGIAVSMAGGSLEFLADGASTKQLHPGLAARAGLTAARLAAAGASGPATALEGERGLFRLFTATDVDPEAVAAELGSRWECSRITLKPYPACQLLHASLDAVAQAASGVALEAIETIHLEVPQDAVDVVCEPWPAKTRPRTAYDAKFSLPWTVAALLVDGAVTVDTFDAAQLGRVDLAAVADRVRYDRVAGPTGQPAASAPGRATLRLRDGRVLTGGVEASRGGPAHPLDEAALLHKLRTNLGDVSAAEALRVAVGGLPYATDLALLLAALPSAGHTTVAENR